MSSCNRLTFSEVFDQVQNHRPTPANTFVRELIQKSDSSRVHISFIYKELLRSMIFNFSQFSVVNDEEQLTPVKTIHANPERAIAKITQETNLILPIISISQPKTKRDNKRQKYKPLVVSEKYWDEKSQRATRIVSLADTPVDIEYEVSIWCRYKNDLDQITEQIHSLFNPDLHIITKYSNNNKIFIMEEGTDSDLVVADREDRVLKRTFTMFASTYVPNPKFLMTSTGKIEEFYIEGTINTETTIQSFNHLEGRRSGSAGQASCPPTTQGVGYGNVTFRLPFVDTDGISGLTDMDGELLPP